MNPVKRIISIIKGEGEGDGESLSWMPAAGSGDGQMCHRTP